MLFNEDERRINCTLNIICFVFLKVKSKDTFISGDSI